MIAPDQAQSLAGTAADVAAWVGVLAAMIVGPSIWNAWAGRRDARRRAEDIRRHGTGPR